MRLTWRLLRVPKVLEVLDSVGFFAISFMTWQLCINPSLRFDTSKIFFSFGPTTRNNAGSTRLLKFLIAAAWGVSKLFPAAAVESPGQGALDSFASFCRVLRSSKFTRGGKNREINTGALAGFPGDG